MSKPFWGYNSEEEARQHGWGDVIDSMPSTEVETDVVDDPTKYPQTSSRVSVDKRIETDTDVIRYTIKTYAK